jgi:prolyl oligopeptidase
MPNAPLSRTTCGALLLAVAACGGPSVGGSTEGAGSAGAEEAALDDPYLWLEDVDSDRALDWVRAQNAVSQGELEADPGFEPLRQRLLSILDSDDRIPALTKRGAHYYNFWRDGEHPRGLWRRTSLESYRSDAPEWDTVLDLDALAEAEEENWVWHGASCEDRGGSRCLVHLSRGGADASVIREFDTATKAFVDDDPFVLPEAKSDVDWIDRDTIFVATDFGEGTLTESGYPRQVRRWRRGTPLSEAELILEGTPEDMIVGAWHSLRGGDERDVAYIRTSFFAERTFIRVGEAFVEVDKPEDAECSVWGGQLLFQLRSDWEVGGETYPAGSLLMSPIDPYLAGERRFVVLFTPSERTALQGYTATRNRIIVSTLEDVRSRLVAFLRSEDGTWSSTAIHSDVEGTQRVSAVDDDASDAYWHYVSDFLRPNTYSLGGADDSLTPLRSEPARFDAEGLVVWQHFTESADGTRIPYFQIGREDPDPEAPTLLYGYGGFEIPLTPGYRTLTGAAWLERGFTLVIANIRGGGEYGARWHRAALRHDRQRAYDDFIAVAEDLIARGVTTPERLGIEGRSNGGLLMGVMLTQRPDLFGAVVCGVPLLDMRRFHLLLAGASWMEEYGDPDDPEDWAAIARYSPYQNVRDGVAYPPTLFTTSTRDDRVHPGHARKMAARMMELDQPVLYYENIEGGHGGAANNAQLAYSYALSYTFLRLRLAGGAD